MVNLTKAQALSAYKKICKALGETPQEDFVTQGGSNWPDGPILVKDFESWYSTTKWAVVWEGGHYEWSYTTDFGLDDKKIFAEPINGYSLGLYPA
jgi:hypothetical protein